MDTKTASALSYLGWWVTGIIFLFVGKNDPNVKFHAARSIITLAPLHIVAIICGSLPFPVNFVGTILYIAAIVAWIYCMWMAWSTNGSRFTIPILSSIVDPYAEKLAAMV